MSTPVIGPIQLASSPYVSEAPFPRVKQRKREADSSHPPSVEVKNAWSYISTPTHSSTGYAALKSSTFSTYDITSQHKAYKIKQEKNGFVSIKLFMKQSTYYEADSRSVSQETDPEH